MRHSQQDLLDTIQVLDPTLTQEQSRKQLQNTLKAINLLTQNVDDILVLREFGTFSRNTVKSRKCHNIQTGQSFMSEPHNTLKFRASKGLKQL